MAKNQALFTDYNSYVNLLPPKPTNMSVPAPNMSTPTGPIYAPPPTPQKRTQTSQPKRYTPPATRTAPAPSAPAAPAETTPPPTTPARPQPEMVTMTGNKVLIELNGKQHRVDEALLPKFQSVGWKRVNDVANTPMQTTPAPAEPKNIFDVYGVDKASQPANIADPYAMYGIEAPTRQKADTSKYDAMIDEFAPDGRNMQRIQENLQMQMADIEKRYGIMRNEAKAQTENEFRSQLSGLYNAGVTNPLSSGTGSIDAASDRILDRRMKAISAQEGAEKAKAIADAYQLETAAQENALQFAQQQRERLETQVNEEYEFDRQQMNDKIGMIESIVGAWKSGQTVERQKKVDAQNNVMDLISTFGSSAFDGMDEETIGEVEAATGYPKGSLYKGLTELKRQEIIAGEEKPEMNLRTVNGSLYNIARNEDGTIRADLVIAKAPTGGGSSSRSSNTSSKDTGDAFSKWLAEKEQRDYMTYNIGDPKVLADLTAEFEKTQPKVDSGEYKYETRNINGQPHEIKKDKKTGRVISTRPLGSSGDDADSGAEELSAGQRAALEDF